ncbi:uncharacterized protein MEPE_03897 [Melanopsichium pennsylvanicum]|uniref:Uncharacterized protein n=2 Tax=Melanopsichium pennsylvanicum TaxID=63383 RepID=A0AAJ4XN35_9BASI|nr:hypothetical protein BN887_04724 [Melanopsichium pennsylvanicum 4]SNX85188.1 uncharacterized protein MEPE_03897 [Melanopsichium pennsylvanicum]
MESAPPSSRSTSSSSACLGGAPQSEPASSVTDISRITPGKGTNPARKQSAPSRSRLSRPFRSPLKRNQSQQSMESITSAATSAKGSYEQTRAEASTLSSASIRKQRQALEGRLLLLQQANNCLRQDTLSTLPLDISRWRQAGQLAAQDLWKLTGAEGGDWSASGGVPTRDDYGLEPPASPVSEASHAHKRKAATSPEPSSPPWLLRRSRFTSPGAEEEAAALRSVEDPVRRPKGEDSQNTDSQTSLPDLSEMLRRSQSTVGISSTPRQRENWLGTQGDKTPTSFTDPESKRGIERKWNIGTMLDMLGADKITLEWNIEEEEFRSPESKRGDRS